MQGFSDAPQSGAQERGGPGRVERDVPRAAALTRPRAGPVRPVGCERGCELVAVDGVRPGDVQNTAKASGGELEQRGREVGDVRRRTDLVDEEGHVVAAGELLLRTAGAAVEERRADDERFGMSRQHGALGAELCAAVRRDGSRLVVLAVSSRRLALAVEDE